MILIHIETFLVFSTIDDFSGPQSLFPQRQSKELKICSSLNSNNIVHINRTFIKFQSVRSMNSWQSTYGQVINMRSGQSIQSLQVQPQPLTFLCKIINSMYDRNILYHSC